MKSTLSSGRDTGNGENGSGNPWPTIRIHPPPILSPATMDDIDEEDELEGSESETLETPMQKKVIRRIPSTRDIEAAKAHAAQAQSVRMQESAQRRRVISTSHNIDYDSDDSTSPMSPTLDQYTDDINDEPRLSLEADLGFNSNGLNGSRMPNLPDWNSGIAKDGRPSLSSLPNNAVSRELDMTIRSLMNEEVFMSFMMDPLGRHRFREYIGQTTEFDLWHDTRQTAQMVQEMKLNAEALRDIYLSDDSEYTTPLPADIKDDITKNLDALQKMNVSFERTQKYLLNSLYNNQFQDFVKYKLVQAMQVKLGKHNLSDAEQEGLGDCFCLTDPYLPDHPIVLVSEGFVGVSGYPKAQIVGRNCRFLQGPGTSPSSVQRIRDALNAQVGCTELLLNYRADGEPFFCLLCILPLHDASGRLVYFIGGQINVTGLLASHKDLGILVFGKLTASQEALSLNRSESWAFSPTLANHKEDLARQMLNFERPESITGQSTASSSRAKSSVAAGAVSPDKSRGKILKRPPPESHGSSGVFGMFKGRPTTPQKLTYPAGGAEAGLGAELRTLDDQKEMFQETYSKIIVFKPYKRRISFVTGAMLRYLGLPYSAEADLYNSPLLHRDLSTMLVSSDKNNTKRVRQDFKDAVHRHEGFSLVCGLGDLGKPKMFGRNEHPIPKYGVIHVTPMMTRDSSTMAMVAIFE